jgi:hypothetical protein
MQPQIKYIRLDQIYGADLNPKDHDIGVIINSIKRFGFNAPLIQNESDQKLVAGHGRLEALIKMYKSQYSVPKGILSDEDNMWLVPVLTGLSFENEEEALSYLIADNKLTEIGGWDKDLLLNMLKNIENLDGVGFDLDDIDIMQNDVDGNWEADDTDRGLGDPRIKYRLIFDNEKHQSDWFKFLEWLNNNSDIENFAGRLTEHCRSITDE